MSYQRSVLVDEYIQQFPPDTQHRLAQLRDVIHATFPHAIEDISYGIPTYRPAPKKRGVVHFSATKDHVGIYGIVDAADNPAIHDKMTPYRGGKGTLQFKHEEKLPLGTIRQILTYYANKIGI